MKDLFIPYETGVPTLLKEKGFNEPCFSYFGDGKFSEFSEHVNSIFTYSEDIFDKDELKEGLIVLAPTYEQIKNWFRTEHNIHIMYGVCGSRTKILGYKWWVQVGMNEDCFQTKMIKDYYVGMTEAIKEALKLIS